MIRAVAVLLTAAAAAAAAATATPSVPAPTAARHPARAVERPVATPPPVVEPSTAPRRPLAGIRIGLDPGHQLGNPRFPSRIERLVPAGGFSKPCNTTGTETNGGYPEATLNFSVVQRARARLEALGATVVLTRSTNREDAWGPCVDQRGLFGAEVGADLVVSVHADGAPASAHGFHVIEPTARAPWTTDIAEDSRRLALALRSGFDGAGIARSTYVNHGSGLDTRADLATLNLSDVPVAMVEVGNMRNAGDARRMTTAAGRASYADAIVAGIRAYLGR